MMIVRESLRGVYHEAEETDTGALTNCGRLLAFADFQLVAQASYDCEDCKNHHRPETIAPAGLRQQRSKKPSFRQPRNLRSETIENARMAHKEIVAGLEWLERGGSGQFMLDALGRLHLAQRFLTDLLISNGIIERPEDPIDD